MDKYLFRQERYNIFLVDPKNRDVQYQLADVFKRAGNSLGMDTRPDANSPSGAVTFKPQDNISYSDMEKVLQRVSKTLQTKVAVSTAETLTGEAIVFGSVADDEETAQLRGKAQVLAMQPDNLLIVVDGP